MYSLRISWRGPSNLPIERAEWAGGKDRKFTKAPAVWLNKGSYLDETCAVPACEPERDAGTFTEADWLQRVAHFEKTGEWSGYWGPQPGKPGCGAPEHLRVRRWLNEPAIRLAPVQFAAVPFTRTNRFIRRRPAIRRLAPRRKPLRRC